MSIMDIINPWGALRRARQTEVVLNKNLAAALDCYHAQRNISHDLAAEVLELEQKLQQAHFRNPKTGRLGKRGETFE